MSLPVTTSVQEARDSVHRERGLVALCFTSDDGEKWSSTYIQHMTRGELQQARDAIDAYLRDLWVGENE